MLAPLLMIGVIGTAGLLALVDAGQAQQCTRTISAKVVALDQVFFWNRLGAVQPHGMVYALRRDVVAIDSGLSEEEGGILEPGRVMLREDKRPRPMVLRMNVGDCLAIGFQNLLNPVPVDNEQPATRTASVHVVGLQLVNDISDSGSFVGQNPSSLVPPGGFTTYTLYAEREGAHLLQSAAAMTGGEGDAGQLSMGLFGGVNVQVQGAEWYRSQVTAADLELATKETLPSGHPIIDYKAVYPPGHPRAGLPILAMLRGNEIVHSDLRAIITGPNAGRFPPGTYRPNPTEPDRDQPFREFTIFYHDETAAVQAFRIFEDPVFEHTLHSTRDAFAINYGTGGIGAEILANRLGVGPMWDCTECKYEEFFLSSWTVADPAMVVDVPANVSLDVTGNPIPGPKATKALYPDDPANVYPSYLRDHVKFRILHSGSDDHHIHHQHTHQWLHTPDSDNSTYLDSQAIGQGSAFTLEMVYNGSGNRNQAVGDSIFHCHFYPHFAQGMWALWRVHDVLELGTPLGADGRPLPGSRALPDAEIVAGVPIPAVVPVPTLAMPPLPQAKVQLVERPGLPGSQIEILGDGNPGYPFFIPAWAGHRPPHPALDTIDDGGLPRHLIGRGEIIEVHTRLDFTKELLNVKAVELPEAGTPVEQAAMVFHEQRFHPSFKPDGSPGSFIANGLPRVAGAPYADPCIDDAGNPVGVPRLYKAADIQLDAILNKAGWHFPQLRLLTLWNDVKPTLDGVRPPEPLFFRANTNDCIEYHLTNLVPNVYELDDFQVRTPTDILGQHIHLVKFDVTASDGAGNGWNYEDGSFSPDEVRERIHAINEGGGLLGLSGAPRLLEPEAHPFFGPGPQGKWLGAQTTVQRWFADDVLNNAGEDRTLRTIFTHDHFGPSTHQQASLYAGLVIEPEGSQWRHPETGEIMGSGFDGGPTSWRADILTSNSADSYREFMFEFQDFQLAYKEGSHPNLPFGRGPTFPLPWEGVARQPGEGFDRPFEAINPPGRVRIGLPFIFARPANAGGCPGGVPVPCPEGISADDPGTASVNYRSEPVALRVRDPETNTQAPGTAGDLAMVYRSNVTRKDPRLNVQPAFYPPLTGGLEPGDPFTPLLRTYEGDKIQVRILVGAQEAEHNFSVQGQKWLFEPSDPNSGWRNSQFMGISEHFEFELAPVATDAVPPVVDYLYEAGAAADDLWDGIWGLLRVYNGRINPQPDLLPLPNNPIGEPDRFRQLREQYAALFGVLRDEFRDLCTSDQRKRFAINVVTAAQALGDRTLIYNPRPDGDGPLHDPTAILLVRRADLQLDGTLRPGVPIEPLILRVNAGDCVTVLLRNRLPDVLPDLDGFNAMPMIVDNFNANQVAPSTEVGLRSQLLALGSAFRDAGMNVGFNPVQTAGPGEFELYHWYAGNIVVNPDGTRVGIPVEFGATSLIPADPIKHTNKGVIGALIVEPEGATWQTDSDSRASATVTLANGQSFREFVVVFQNDINLRHGDGTAVPVLAVNEDAEESGQKGLNYRTEPIWLRMGVPADIDEGASRQLDFTNVLSNIQVGGDPVTPIFKAAAGTPVRFRVVHPGGHPQGHVFGVSGHIWQEEPYIKNSEVIGDNPLSEWKGAQMGHGPKNHFDAVLENGAGGAFAVPGDYLYRDHVPWYLDNGLWGIFRVTP